MVRAKVVTVMRWYAQDEVNQEESEQDKVDGMKKDCYSSLTNVSTDFVFACYHLLSLSGHLLPSLVSFVVR